MSDLGRFRQVWFLDFEFHAPAGELAEVLCFAALEIRSGTRIMQWADELPPTSPIPISPDVLAVAYFASAELGCFLQLGWAPPANLIDLFVEFRNATNGSYLAEGQGLLGAAAYYGLPGLAKATKDENRELAIRGGPFTAAERKQLLAYCFSDVELTRRLLQRMAPSIKLGPALLRGEYMASVAAMEHVGIPVDVESLDRIRGGWDSIQDRLIEEIDEQYGVYEGRTFKIDRFDTWLLANEIAWPRTPTGRPALDDDTMRQMARSDLRVAPLRELRAALAQLRRNNLAVGRDGRNRCLLSPFRSRTGRNQPSNAKFLFGASVWLRGLIKPSSGSGVAYIDWSQQEFGTAAALSGDENMMRSYLAGDPYLEFAKLAGAAPREATKESHKAVRDRFKECVLAVQYGMGPRGLAERLGIANFEASELLRAHRRAFPGFWEWSDGAVAYGQLAGELWTVFGWRLRITTDPNPRALANFPAQANGAEMMRLAAIYAHRSGIRVCAPVHDAFLIEAPLGELEATVEKMQASMAQASRDVLGGFELRTDTEIVRYPGRYMDPRGKVMWDRVMGLLDELEQNESGPVSDCGTRLFTNRSTGITT